MITRRWAQPRPEPPLPLFDRSAAAEPAATSRAAGRSISHAREYIEQRLVEYILARSARGATCEEAETALELRHSTASARISELARAGRIANSGRTRPTSSGRAAIVWIDPSIAAGGPPPCAV